MVSDNSDQIVQALRVDLGKHEQEAFSQEITLTLQDIINVVKNVSFQSIYLVISRLIIGQKMNMFLWMLHSSSTNVVFARNPLASF